MKARPGTARRLAARAALASSGLLASTTLALACPACAGRDGSSAGVVVSMAGIIALPFLIAAFVVPALRRGPSHRS